jgi:hypothetical protein
VGHDRWALLPAASKRVDDGRTEPFENAWGGFRRLVSSCGGIPPRHQEVPSLDYSSEAFAPFPELEGSSPICCDEARDAAAQIDKRRNNARNALLDLSRSLDELGRLRAVLYWLADGSGLDHGRGMHGATVPRVTSSARRTANGEALTVDVLLGWLSEVVDPPTPPVNVEQAQVATATSA